MVVFIQKPFLINPISMFLLLYLWGATPFCWAEMVYQDFESGEADLCWTWDQDATVSSEIVHWGSYSCKLQGTNNNNGIGVKSKQGWHTDLGNHDRLTFWIYALPDHEIEKENTVLVKFFDHGIYHESGYEMWTTSTARYSEWTQLAIPLSQLPNDFNRHDVDKIEFLNYWPGIYYFDNIQIETMLRWDYSLLRKGVLQWQPISGAEKYRLEENTTDSLNDWQVVYEGTETRFTIPRFTPAHYRVRVELPWVSDWSKTVTSAPLVVLIKHAQLQQGILEWLPLSQAESYELQSATNLHGPWDLVYQGPYPTKPISILEDTWYRVRALEAGETETTAWSPPQWKPSTIEKGVLRAQGTTIRDSYGNEVILRGVNLGGLFLNEKWLTGLGDGDQPPIEDDWSLREILQSRFGTNAAQLLNIYQEAFFKEEDCDILMQMGLNVIRLPIFYRNLQDDEGNWITDSQGKIDFGKIDRIVNSCADRGIYTLLDLHGAPGSQSNAEHTGRMNFNKLFEDSPAGEAFQNQTIRIWEAIAIHYQNHPAVVGYDLLNEPIGVESNFDKLWHLYDRLYQAIRSQDPYHIIVMEGVWYEDIVDWDTLPIPAELGWENVVYQFHFYNWGHDNDLQNHKEFIDDKIAQSKQEQYQVPVMIGEFNGFALPEIWEYDLEQFNEKRWSWMLWNYKARDPNSNWGLYTHIGYDEPLPKFRAVQEDGSAEDSSDDLARKLAKYDTLGHYSPNHQLIEVVQRFAKIPKPDIKINGTDGTVEIRPSDNRSITVAVDAGGFSGKEADWWLVKLSATIPFDWYYFDYLEGSMSWLPGISVAHQSPLFNLHSYEVPKLNLPLGAHIFYFGIDLNQNGKVDEPSYYDTVIVNVVP